MPLYPAEVGTTYTISPSVDFRVSHGMFYVSGCLPQGSGEDILRSVLIAVVVRSARRTRPFADGQILRDGMPMPATGTSLARRVKGIDLQDGRAAPCSFVSEQAEELRPARVRDCPRKMMIPQHILDLQVLDGDDPPALAVESRQPSGVSACLLPFCSSRSA